MDLRRTYWTLRVELRELVLWLVCALPAGSGIWLRARLLPRFFASFGTGTVIQENFRVTTPARIHVGRSCNFGRGVFLTGGGGITIGDHVGIGPDSKVWSVNHRFADPDVPWLEQGYDEAAVVVEDDVWIGANCFVMPGTTIGRGAILSAGTVLMKSVPPCAIVAGNPGRIVGWRRHPDGGAPAQDNAGDGPGEEAMG